MQYNYFTTLAYSAKNIRTDRAKQSLAKIVHRVHIFISFLALQHLNLFIYYFWVWWLILLRIILYFYTPSVHHDGAGPCNFLQ